MCFLFSDTVDGNIAYGDSPLRGGRETLRQNGRRGLCGKRSPTASTPSLASGAPAFRWPEAAHRPGLALAVRPSILILDDTTSAVDLETEKYIQEQLSSLDFPCTKIIVAQRISTTKRADKIVILDKGRVVDVGTHQELSQRPGYYREVFLLQTAWKRKRRWFKWHATSLTWTKPWKPHLT